jgi:hypothetical protein
VSGRVYGVKANHTSKNINSFSILKEMELGEGVWIRKKAFVFTFRSAFS